VTRSQRQAEQTASHAPAKRQTGATVVTAWRHLVTAGRQQEELPTVWCLAPGGETLPPGALFR